MKLENIDTVNENIKKYDAELRSEGEYYIAYNKITGKPFSGLYFSTFMKNLNQCLRESMISGVSIRNITAPKLTYIVENE